MVVILGSHVRLEKDFMSLRIPIFRKGVEFILGVSLLKTLHALDPAVCYNEGVEAVIYSV